MAALSLFPVGKTIMAAFTDSNNKDGSSSTNGSVSKPCTPFVHIKIAGKWMFIPLKMGLIGIDPYPND